MLIKTYQNLASGQVRRSSKVDLEVKEAVLEWNELHPDAALQVEHAIAARLQWRGNTSVSPPSSVCMWVFSAYEF